MNKITKLIRGTKSWVLSSVTAFACSVPTGAQIVQQYFGTPDKNEVAVDVHALPDGGYVAGGYVTSANCTQTDCYLFRVNAAGALMWARRFGSVNDEQIQRVVVAGNGDIICAGFGLTGGKYRGIAARFTATGTMLWSNSYVHSGTDDAIYFDANELPNGNVALVGASNYANTAAFGRNSLITVVSPTGTTVWSRIYFANSWNTEFQGVVGVGNDIIAAGKAAEDGYLSSVNATTGVVNWSYTYKSGNPGRQTNYFGRLYVRNNRLLTDGQNTQSSSPTPFIDHAITTFDMNGLNPSMEITTANSPGTGSTIVEFGTFFPITDTRFVEVMVPGNAIYNPCSTHPNAPDVNIINVDNSGTTTTDILALNGDQQVYSIDINSNTVYLSGCSRGGPNQIGNTDAYIVKYNIDQFSTPDCILNSGRVIKAMAQPIRSNFVLTVTQLTPITNSLEVVGEEGTMAIACGRFVPTSNCSDSCYWRVTGNNIIGGNNIFGTLTPNDVQIKTSGVDRGIMGSNGMLGWNTMSPTALVHVLCDGNTTGSGLPVSDVRFENLEPGNGTLLVIDNDGYVYNSGQSIGGTGTGINNLCNIPDMVPKVNPAGDLDCSQIYDDGQSVGINTTGPFGYTWPGGSGSLSDPFTPIPIFGTLSLDVNGMTRGLAFYATSDEKFKTNIKQITDPSAIINKLNGKTYQWNEKAKKEMRADNTVQYGFIAQEVAKTLPEAVIIDEKGNYAINYNSFIPVLVESQKELNIKLEQQSAINEKLQNELGEVKAMLNELQNCCMQSGSGYGNKATTDGNALYQNTPNPFGRETVIEYRLSVMNNNAYIIIFDMNGKEVQRSGITAKGSGKVKVNAEKMMSGMYLYALVVDGREVDTKKMVLIK